MTPEQEVLAAKYDLTPEDRTAITLFWMRRYFAHPAAALVRRPRLRRRPRVWCKVCLEPVEVFPSALDRPKGRMRGRITCSRACAAIARRRRTTPA